MENNQLMSVQSLEKSFGDLKVLKDISLSIQKGEIIAVIGPSGSGKSTLLRSLNYLESVEKGTMIFNNKKIEMPSISEKERQGIRQSLTMVFQQYNLFANKSALENIMEGLLITKKNSKEVAREKAAYYLDKVNLSDKENSYPHQLSGGQQQRVGIARALAMEPEIILFDEPTSALDPELVGEVLKVIREVANENSTMVIVTHEMTFAREIADRIVFMDEGRILANQSTNDFFEKQTNPRILNFIKSITLEN